MFLKKYVENYKFDRISSKMAKGFGTIPRGKEELYDFMLLPMEGNLLKLHRMVPERNGRRAIEAIHMCLLKVDGYINKIEYDLDRFITNENDAFFKGLLESFDPFTNQVLFDLAKNTYDLYSENDLKIFLKNLLCAY